MDRRPVERKDFIVPRCTAACPAGVDVPRYIRAVKDQKYDEAVAILRERLPLPTVCADACFAPCEEVCAYKQFGDPIAIRAIKRAAVDKGGDIWKKRKKVTEKTGKRVAVVGAGPAGLTAAYYLVTKGHDVTVFDSFSKPGGTMRYGIPNYRLPDERLDKDIDDILQWGVTFQGETKIGREITLDQIKKDFDAVFIASGANGSAKISLEGTEKEGVLWGWEFLRDVGKGEKIEFKGDVVVVGSGNVAIDSALTAFRLGAKNVHLTTRKDRKEMLAYDWEIAQAEEQGIVFHDCWSPKKILGKETVEGLALVRAQSTYDEKTCGYNVICDDEITEKLEANYVILAVGQTPELDFLKNEKNVNTDLARIEVKQDSLATGEEGIFAGGDAVSGPDSILGAIAHGRIGATAIDKYLGGDGNIDEVLATPEEEVILSGLETEIRPRAEMPCLKSWGRNSGFEQVELGLTDEQIAAESSRCLNCDAIKFEVILNVESCKECGYCAEVCGVGAFGPAEFFNAKGYRPEEVKTSDWCVGCYQCYFACPDFAIDVIAIAA